MFDLFEYRQRATNSMKPKDLFNLWEEVCRYYDRGEIGKLELDEMRSLICPTLKSLTALQRSVDDLGTTGIANIVPKQA